jgi:hypothetical protein
MLLHFIAFWFFIHAFQTFSWLHNTKLMEAIRQPDQMGTKQIFADDNILPSEVIYLVLCANICSLVGLVVAFIISLSISIKKHWFWVNAVVVLLLVYFLNRFDLLGWTFFKQVFLSPGEVFQNITIEILVNGIILLTIGLLIFFSGRLNRFIENKYSATA